jgi:hypothetical protein
MATRCRDLGAGGQETRSLDRRSIIQQIYPGSGSKKPAAMPGIISEGSCSLDWIGDRASSTCNSKARAVSEGTVGVIAQEMGGTMGAGISEDGNFF